MFGDDIVLLVALSVGDYVRVATLAKNINRRGVYAFKKYCLLSGFLR